MLSSLGFQEIDIARKERSNEIIRSWNVGPGAEHRVFSAYVRAIKPLLDCCTRWRTRMQVMTRPSHLKRSPRNKTDRRL
jgi:hypothetical protein